jgi:hypothetical protein
MQAMHAPQKIAFSLVHPSACIDVPAARFKAFALLPVSLIFAAASLLNIKNHKPRAFAGKAERNGAADAGARTGDDSDVILQKPRHVLLPLWRLLQRTC